MQLVIPRATRKILLGVNAADYKGQLGGVVIPNIQNCTMFDFGSSLRIKDLATDTSWEIQTLGDWFADRLLMLIIDGISRAKPEYRALFIRQKRLGDSGTELVAAFTST